MAQISIDPSTQDAQAPISLDTEGQTVTPLSPDVVQSRARKAEFGLGPVTGVTKEQAHDAISSGQEMQLRRQAAAQIDLQRSNEKTKLIEQMAKSGNGSISPDQLKYVEDQYSLAGFMGQQPPTNPNTVLEQYYAGEYMKPMYDISDQFNHGSFMPEAQREIPEHVSNIKATSQNLTAAREMIRTRLEDAKAKAADQSYLGRAADFTKELLPGYTESALKGGWSQIFRDGGRGTALRADARRLWALPPDELKSTFDAKMTELEKKDPALAVEYGEHMLGFSTSEENLQNFFTGLDISSIPAVAIGKAALSGGKAIIKGTAEATGITEALAKKAALYNQTTKAAADAVKATETQGVPLSVLRNQHFGEEASRLNYEIAQDRVQYKHIANLEIDKYNPNSEYANEGLRSQALTRTFNRIQANEERLKSLKNWHAENSIEGSDGHIIVNQTVEKDPEITAAVGRGDLKTAGVAKANVEVAQEAKDPAAVVTNTIDALMDGMRGDTIAAISNPGHGGQEFVNRMREGGDSFVTKVKAIAQSIMRVQRIPAILANRQALNAIVEYTKDLYPGIRNSILNVSDPILNRDLNTYTQKMTFGRMTGEYFANGNEAQQFAVLHGLTADIHQSGLGWYLEVSKPLDETMHPIRDWLIKTKESETPGGWLNATVGWLRTPEDTLSLEQNMQRKLATYNVAPFMTFAKESIQDIKSLGGIKNAKNVWSQWKDWERAVAYSRDAPVPGSTSGEKGYFFQTGQELDDFWMRNFDNKLPTITQKAAYFQFKRIVEYDRVLRSMAVFRNKWRLGVEAHSISLIDAKDNKLTSEFFDGVTRNHLPGGTGNIWIADRGPNAIYAADSMGSIRPTLEEAITKGELKVIELYATRSRPLKGFAGMDDSLIRYVVVKDGASKPINVAEQVPRKGGPHFEYDFDHYIKQADMSFDERSKVHTYEGDNTLMPITSRGMGMKLVERLNQVRELIRDGKLDEAEKFAMSKEGVPLIPWDKHLGWYQESKDSLGRKVKPRLNVNEELRVVSKDNMISDVDNTLQARFEAIQGHRFQNVSRQGSLETGNQVQYTGQRDAYDVMTSRDIGTKQNPLFNYEPAKFVDPIETMNRSLSRIVTSTLMDDYKIYSVESWIKEAKNWLVVGNRNLDDIDRSPFYYFNHPEWKSDMPQDMKAILEGNRLKIQKLVGTPSKTDTFLHSASQALADSVYNKFGPKYAELTPNWLIPSLRDPTRFFRSIVFNEKMGLFSVPQFLVHAMTFANVLGIAGPKNGSIGAMGAMFHMWASANSHPNIIEALDKLAGNFGMKPGFFKEAHELSLRTGFMDVAGEHVFLDAPLANRIIQNKGASFLDAGQIFFRGGVKSLRAGSWYTAVKEFRDIHPVGAITDDDLKGILYRADLLSHNMSRASTSVLTTGVMAIPAQFYTYQLRLMELMFGNRLTYVEKARLMGVNAALFGVPVASGLVGTSYFGENIKSYANEHGYQIGDNFLTDVVMQGLPAMIGKLISGNVYNIGERYGAKGIEPVSDVVEGDKTFLQIFGGASLNSLSNTIEQSNGLMHLIMSGIRGDGKALGSATPEDFIGPFKEITSVNGVFKVIAAARFGNWLSKNNAVLHPNSPANAVFEALTGLSEQQDTDMWTKSQDLKANKAYENKLFGMFQNRFSLGMQEANIKNYDQSQAYFKEAFNILHQGGYPEDKIPEAVASALESNKTTLIDRTNYNYFLKKLLPQQTGKQ